METASTAGDLAAKHSEEFARFVLSHQNFALMMMGSIPNPETGALDRNLDAARIFIDQLEMIEAKTSGNLSKEEKQLLTGSLTTLRLTFVQAMNEKPAAAPTPAQTPTPAQQPAPESPDSAATGDSGDSKKKFSKTY